MIYRTASVELWGRATYAGSFRVSADNERKTGYASRFGYGGGTIALGPNADTMMIEGHAHRQMVAEVKIPEIVKSRSAADLRIAEFAQPFFYIDRRPEGGGLGGLAYDSDLKRWWWTVEQGYDVDPTHYRSIGWTGMDPTGVPNLADKHGPWLCDVGNKLTERYIQAILVDKIADTQFGGRYLLTGQAGVAGTAGSSQGFCLTAVEEPAEDGETLDTKRLLFYPQTHPLPMEGPEKGHWYRTEKAPSMAWLTVDGEHYVAFTAIVGTGVGWYGPGNDPPEGGIVDRWKPAKGYHAPPYEERLYIYTLDEILRVARGEIESWDARPAESVDLRPHLYNPGHAWCCLAFDTEKQRLYISEDNGDGTQNRYETVPVIHAFDFGEPTPEPEPEPIDELMQRIMELEAALVECREEAASAAERIAELEAKIESAREALQ